MVDNYYSNTWVKLSSELVQKGYAKDSELEAFAEMLASPDKENTYLAEEIIRLRLEEAYLEKLNDGQKKAFVGLIKFIRDPEDYEGVVLKGYAGTGKTYLIKTFVEYITKAYPHRGIAVTAPTNKAVKVLSRGSVFQENVFSTSHSNQNKITYGTIHSLLNLKQHIDDKGVITFKPAKKKDKNKKSLGSFKYLIVDEASMLNNELYECIKENRKDVVVIYMGDPAQIPPVNEVYSKPFDDNNPDKLYKLELSEIMRQKGNNPIINKSMLIRQRLTIKDPLPDLETVTTEDGSIVLINAKTERNQIRPLIKKLFDSAKFKANSDYAKIIAYRNASVNYLNKVVREVLHGEKAEEKYLPGDLLIANSSIFNGGELIANTSTEFIVMSTSKQTRTFKPKLKFGGVLALNPNFKAEGVLIQAKQVDTGQVHTLWVITEEEEEVRYQSYLSKLKSIAIKAGVEGWLDYYAAFDFSNNIDYAYAITAHKSQGSTYENVILIEEDIALNFKTVEKNRILYTAYTRTSTNLYLLK